MTGGTVQRAINAAPCHVKCAGGQPCCCNGRAHQHHICSSPDCRCHAAESYGVTRQIAAPDAAVYVPVRRLPEE